jgi:tRNA pseudouridine38-40 synthase
MRKAWNGLLPKDILIRSIKRIDVDFRPQHNVHEKTYDYYIFTHRPLPFVARYGWYYPRSFDPIVLEKALQVFVGTHDFYAFCAEPEVYDDTVRTVNHIELQYLKKLQAYRIRVKGQGFLRYMVRRMVGAAVTVASHSTYTIERIQNALYHKTLDTQLLCAPPEGLVLRKIMYASDTIEKI